MELRQIWNILLRRWWLVLIPPLIVAAASLRNWRSLLSPPVSYSTAVRFTVGQPPADPATGFDPRYYSWLTSEYIAAGLREWIKGAPYAALVSQDLQARHGLSLSAGQIQGALAADSARSQVVLYLNWPDAEQLKLIADSAVRVLTQQNAGAYPQFGQGGVLLTALDDVNIATNAPGLRERLDLPLRAGLALVAGLGLAFLVEYLDPTLRSRREVEDLGLEVIAALPRRARWRRN